MIYNIHSIRTQKDMSLAQLGKLSNVSESHLNNLENGVKNATLKVLERIAKALDVPICHLYQCPQHKLCKGCNKANIK